MVDLIHVKISNYMDKQQKTLWKRFGNTHWLSSQNHVEQFLMANTFYRRNLHRFARDYLGLSLHWYQSIILYLMGISNFIVIIASRAAAKSFVIAIFSCCKAILYPGSEIVLTSGTRGQSKLIVTKKISGELCPRSPNLRREIEYCRDNQTEVIVKFRNSSSICTVTCSPTARGNRCTVDVGEEAREIDKKIMDTVISPFQVVRQAPFMMLKEYKDDPQFKEEPTEIFISSSMEESHWLYKTACEARNGMLKNNGSFFVAFDYSITLKHGIRTRRQLARERRKVDPVTFAIEYENLVLRSNENAYFPYDLVKSNCVLKRAFYPRKHEDVINKIKNKYFISKQPGEIRIVSCDIAALDRPENDNSSFSLLRLFPETVGNSTVMREEFRIQTPYLEAFKGTEGRKQAIRIRQLYDDFDSDYIVLDIRNFGLSVYESLARVLYDDERGVEYAPMKAMNDELLANRIMSPNAQAKIFCIAASAKLNNDMVVNLKNYLTNHKIDLLVSKDEGVEEIIKYVPEYSNQSQDIETQLYFERPYLETMLLRKELCDLTYTKAENTGLIRVKEPSDGVKDRFSSVEMGVWFASLLALDLLNKEEEIPAQYATLCVSPL